MAWRFGVTPLGKGSPGGSPVEYKNRTSNSWPVPSGGSLRPPPFGIFKIKACRVLEAARWRLREEVVSQARGGLPDPGVAPRRSGRHAQDPGPEVLLLVVGLEVQTAHAHAAVPGRGRALIEARHRAGSLVGSPWKTTPWDVASSWPLQPGTQHRGAYLNTLYRGWSGKVCFGVFLHVKIQKSCVVKAGS